MVEKLERSTAAALITTVTAKRPRVVVETIATIRTKTAILEPLNNATEKTITAMGNCYPKRAIWTAIVFPPAQATVTTRIAR